MTVPNAGRINSANTPLILSCSLVPRGTRTSFSLSAGWRWCRWASLAVVSGLRRVTCRRGVGVRLGDPVLQQGVGDGQHHRTEEQPEQAECQEAADHADEDEQKRQIGA